MEVLVEHLGDVQFEVKARNHVIICDQPVEHGGFDEGMTPPEFLLAALGSCAGYYAARYLKGRNLATAGLRIRATSGKASNPARMVNFEIEVRLPDAVGERHREGLLRAIHACLIHNTLLEVSEIKADVVCPAAV